jgi:putative peptidoglycan lipid II flippase
MAGALVWASGYFDWLGLKAHSLTRVGLLLACVAAAAMLYFASLAATGVKLKQFIKR